MTPGERALGLVREAAADAVNDAAEDVLSDALLETPHGETGALARSGRVSERATRDHAHAEVRFGGDGPWGHVPYGAAQHEGEAWQVRDGRLVHWVVRKRPGGGKSKFLEHALYAEIPRFEAHVVRRVRERLG